MKVFRSIKAFLLSIWHSMFFKYAVVCILGVLIVGFLDENSFWSHMKNRQRINELQEETAKYNAEFQRDQARIRELDRNPKAMEKIARERFFMKADDEDIFVLSDDDREIKGVVGDETAE
ncbi:MAG: septum formation initiator family protein [Prevotella sp.]|nr:septum formation initiator family protein [Prevotella sp.]